MFTSTGESKRIEALDYLRGFFIFVIIVDHLWRWPNLFEYVSGRGELWSSAAEGFVIISGLLVGYIRGRKGLKKSFGEISKKLVLRGVMLYAWTLITTFLLVAATWFLSFKSGVAWVPYDKFQWEGLIPDTLSLQYAHTLTHFLYLYAIFLVISPLLVWLLRKGWWWVGAILSIATWWYGLMSNNEWMQWQILFFLPATAGFYLDQIIGFFRNIPTTLINAFTFSGLITIVLSALVILPSTPGSYTLEVFTREPLSLARILLSFVWFVSLAWFFNKLLPWLEKWTSWLLLPFGTKSLTAYIVHSFILMAISFLFPVYREFWQNTLIVCITVLITLLVLRIPGINRVIPR